MPKKVNTVGLEMPDDFPVDAYNAVHARVSPKREPRPAAWPEWASAWNAVAYRFQSCVEHAAAFTKSIRQHGDAPAPPTRYIQERELFNFFTNGLAAIES